MVQSLTGTKKLHFENDVADIRLKHRQPLLPPTQESCRTARRESTDESQAQTLRQLVDLFTAYTFRFKVLSRAQLKIYTKILNNRRKIKYE